MARVKTGRITKKKHKKIPYDKWLENFSNIFLQLRQYTDIFKIISPFHFFHSVYINPEEYNNIYPPGDIKENLKNFNDDIKKLFIKFEYIKEYIYSCLTDDSFYDINKLEFAIKYYFNIEHEKINGFEKDMFDLNYDIRPRQFIGDFDNAKEFIADLDKKFKSERKTIDERFKTYDKVYYTRDLGDFVIIELYEILKAGYKFKSCENCGAPFIPYKRSDTLYCDRPAPQNYTKTCKEYGGRQAYQESLKTNKSMRLYRNIYMAKQMLAKRHPELKGYHEDFEKYIAQAVQWKKDVKAGLKTDDEYITWLKSVRGKRYFD